MTKQTTKSQFQIEREQEGWVFYKNAGTWEEDRIFMDCVYKFKKGERRIVAGVPPLDFSTIEDFLITSEAYERDGRKIPQSYGYQAVYFKRKKEETAEEKKEPTTAQPDLQKLFMLFKQEFKE